MKARQLAASERMIEVSFSELELQGFAPHQPDPKSLFWRVFGRKTGAHFS